MGCSTDRCSVARTTARSEQLSTTFERRDSGVNDPFVAHYTFAMDNSSNPSLPDYRCARHPSRVYQGRELDGEFVVTVFDSALPCDDQNPRTLSPAASKAIRDASPQFGWGTECESSLQLAVALLFDVSGDARVALRWCEQFTRTYVGQLAAVWTVPEVDIALWLYCYENAGPQA